MLYFTMVAELKLISSTSFYGPTTDLPKLQLPLNLLEIDEVIFVQSNRQTNYITK